YQPGDYTVRDASHWFFAGTGVVNGQIVGQQLAFGETDGIGHASPPVIDILLAGRNSTRVNPAGPAPQPFDAAVATFYEDSLAYGFPNGHGGGVFSAGSQSLGNAMMDGDPDHVIVRRMLRNLMDHFLANPPAQLSSLSPLNPKASRPRQK